MKPNGCKKIMDGDIMNCQQDLNSDIKLEVNYSVLKTEQHKHEDIQHFHSIRKTVMDIHETCATIKNEEVTDIKSEVKDERYRPLSGRELEEDIYSSAEEDEHFEKNRRYESDSSCIDSDDSVETSRICQANNGQGLIDDILIHEPNIPHSSNRHDGHRKETHTLMQLQQHKYRLGSSNSKEDIIPSQVGSDEDLLHNDAVIDEFEDIPAAPGTKGDQSSALFKWEANESYLPKVHAFEKSGGCIDAHIKENPSILDCFELFVSHDILRKIAWQTNIFLRQKEQKSSEYIRNKQGAYINESEIYCFIALSFLMPLVKKLRLKDYWSKNAAIATPFFSQVMSRDRYLLILSHLHFSDNNNSSHREDQLCKISLLLDHFTSAFKKVFQPFQNLYIDQSLTLAWGPLYFQQNISRSRFGVRLFVIYDCQTGYIHDFLVYCGTSSDIAEHHQDIGKSGNIVYTLMGPYLNCGHTLYTNDWCTSPLLFKILYDKKTNACGAVKINSQHMPEMRSKLSSGQIEHYETENLLALKYQGKCEVTMLSSCHTAEKVPTGKMGRMTNEIVYKPDCIVQYKKNVGVVHHTDILQSAVGSSRRNAKWYKKVFFHLLDMSLLNAHVIYKMKTGSNMPLAEYRLALVREIVGKYHMMKPRSSYKRNREADSPLRLTERHFISKFPNMGDSARCRPGRCVVCSKQNQRRETRYYCEQCNVPLCIVPCFEKYHTVKHY